MKYGPIITTLFLSLFPHKASGQSDLEVAKQFVATLPHTMHGMTWESGISHEDLEHIRQHDSLYVHIIKETISWPDTLLLSEPKVHLYDQLLGILVTANSKASQQFLIEVYNRSSAHFDSVQANPIIDDESSKRMLSLMSTSIRGLTHTYDDALLNDAINRYDTLPELDQDTFLEYIKLYRSVNPEIESWLERRGL